MHNRWRRLTRWKCNNFAGFNVKRNALNDRDRICPIRACFDLEVADFENVLFFGHRSFLGPLDHFLGKAAAGMRRDIINDQVDGNGDRGDGRSRCECCPDVSTFLEVHAHEAFADHTSPLGRRRLNAKAEETEAGNEEDHENES